MSNLKYLDFFKNRSSVRRFTDKPVSEQTLDTLLEAAAQAPTTGNMQLYSVVVTREPKRLKQLVDLHLGQPAAAGANVILTFCGDVARFERWCKDNNAQSTFRNLHGSLLGVIDATIFAQQFVTLAEMNGIGCCYLGTVTYNLDEFCDFLGTPDGVMPLFSVALGYPAPDGVAPVSDRLPKDAYIHRERFSDYDSKSIAKYYAEKEKLPESKKFIKENGKQTLAQVYSEVRYPSAQNEQISGVLKHRLKLD